ncbi:exo-alpha-sialidase [Mucilaginibacter sp. SMC90]|uniref:exo-alpha-sialidase n=1 Tax=Mucilaginibacter sp. SMC90 TaxID=2929803 RepID=UPI001FB43AE9|nr:exo-alpha-sialidase [Mucilaginibacter sp. SMC90]UOE46901.1 exo-alpha-sialidase [Mucilaginibacter sp. SMC90]
MSAKLKLLFAISLFLSAVNSNAQTVPISNNYQTETGVPKLNIERSMVYSPDKEWLYNHHASIIHFKDRFVAIWSDGMTDEDSPGQRVVYAISKDFKHWSPLKVLASPGKINDTLTVLTAAGFYQYKGTLVAYYGDYDKHRQNTHLWAKTSTDGEHWSEPLDMHLPVVPNHGPEMTNSGRLIISGNFTFPYTDDPRGLSGWKLSSFYPDSLYQQDNPAMFYAPAAKSGLPPLCEGSFFQTDDNVLHMLLRVTGKGWKGHLWLTESKDNGGSWSRPAEAPFSDNDSKFHFGRLPDKRFYYVGIPDTLHHYDRNPLVLSLSKDGKSFDKNYIITNELYHLKKEGLWKGGQYGYPHTIIYKGYMYVIISRQKEAIETLRFSLRQLK